MIEIYGTTENCCEEGSGIICSTCSFINTDDIFLHIQVDATWQKTGGFPTCSGKTFDVDQTYLLPYSHQISNDYFYSENFVIQPGDPCGDINLALSVDFLCGAGGDFWWAASITLDQGGTDIFHYPPENPAFLYYRESDNLSSDGDCYEVTNAHMGDMIINLVQGDFGINTGSFPFLVEPYGSFSGSVEIIQ